MPFEPRQDPIQPENLHDDWDDPAPLELDDDRWDVFLPDYEPDPLPEPSDFWIEFDRREDLLEAA